MDANSRQELTVNGMTCGHCAQTLTAALSALPGVESVEVDVTGGRATIQSEQPLNTGTLEEAVREAGFDLTAVRKRTR